MAWLRGGGGWSFGGLASGWVMADFRARQPSSEEWAKLAANGRKVPFRCNTGCGWGKIALSCTGGGILARMCGSVEFRTAQGDRESMAYVIAEPCIGTKDTACVDACPVDCIHPKKDEEAFASEEMLYIDPVECIDCGACVPVCPVSAIFVLDDLPEKWKAFTERNAQYYGR